MTYNLPSCSSGISVFASNARVYRSNISWSLEVYSTNPSHANWKNAVLEDYLLNFISLPRIFYKTALFVIVATKYTIWCFEFFCVIW